MDLSLFYFANDSGGAEADRYRLLLEGARFADENGFAAVWTPERHFHPFGGTYPNPSVTSAAIAATTERVKIRAGSVVAPLHHALRIAEEWSVVDNISQGRVGVSFASGWHAVDFALNPAAYENRRTEMYERIEQVRTLWRGEAIEVTDGAGNPVQVRSFPPPVQSDLPIWVASVGDVETFRSAGRIGAGLLTHLLGQSPEQLADKIAEYRKAAAEAGHPGHVTVMVHTYLGEDTDTVKELVRPSLSTYMRSSLGLILASDLSTGDLEPDEIDMLVDRAFEHYFDNVGLLGSVDKGEQVVARLAELGVDEIACLIDFGLPTDEVMTGLTYLKRLQDACGGDAPDQRLVAVRDHLDGLIRPRLTSPFSYDVPLVSLGFDSLAAIELWSRLRTDLGVDVQAAELLELTLDGLTERVLAEGGSVAASAAGPGTGEPAGADLDDASPEAAAQLLAALDGLDDAGMERLVTGFGPVAETTPAG